MKVLLLAGTAEARELAELAQCSPALDVIASLAGHTGEPRRLPCELRTGGFGGIDGLARYLTDRAIDAVLDATHPFADKHAAARTGGHTSDRDTARAARQAALVAIPR